MKVLVAHPQRQHSFQLCSALVAAGHDVIYVTTVYDKKWSLTRIAMRFLSGDNLSRAKGRHCDVLDDSAVMQKYELLGLVSLLLGRMPKKKKMYKRLNAWIDRLFGRAVARTAVRRNVDAVVCYDQHAEAAFSLLKIKNPNIIRILDVSTANKQYQALLVLGDLDTKPKPRGSWRNMALEPFDLALREYAKEVYLSHFFLVPSKFAADSIRFLGVDPDRIFQCSYGAHFRLDSLEQVDSHNPMRFVYCGRMCSGKGLHRLLEAFDGIDRSRFELTLIGSYAGLEKTLEPWLDKYTFTGGVLQCRVKEIYCESDVFVFPTLYEGMSLACLEAMSCGLPLVVSSMAGVTDLVDDYANGFILKSPSDIGYLREKIEWCIDHPADVADMKVRALERSRNVTWEKYGMAIAKAFRSIERNG